MIYLNNSNNFANFVAWIGNIGHVPDKGKLTTFPHYNICQQNFKNVSNMLRFEDLPEINSPRWLSLDDLEGEIWKDVVGFEEILQISCYGRLKRKKRYSYNRHSGDCLYNEKILRLYSQKNYQHTCISIGQNTKHNFSIHRVVAEAFIPNPNKLPSVNHKDENPRNNCVDNLEWCTPKYNSNYGTIKYKQRQKRIENNHSCPVVLYDYEGNELKSYETMKDAAIENNISRELIAQCCRGEVGSAKGLHFRFKGEEYKSRKFKNRKNTYKVYRDGVFLFEEKETKRLCKKLDLCYSSFRRLLNGIYKSYCKLKEYEINIYTQEGVILRIKNGKALWI